MRAVAVSPSAPPKWKAYMARQRVRSFQEGGPADDQDVTGASRPMTLDDYYAQPAGAPEPSAPDTEPAGGQPMTLDDYYAMPQRAPASPDVSAGGAVAIGAARAAAPAVGSVAGMLAGAKAGAILGAGAGALTGPFAEVASPVLGTIGGFAGGVAGAMGSGYILNKAQDWVLDKLGLLPKVEEYSQAAREQHPYAEFAGELLPAAASFKFGDAPKLVRAFYGLGAAGLEAGQEYAQEGTVDPFKVGASGLVGAALTEPARAGAVSERLVGRAFGQAGNFVDRLRGTTPADVADKADAQTIRPTDNAQGSAPVQPPPVEADVKPTETGGASTGSEREYPKDARPAEEGGPAPATEAPPTTVGDVKPDVAAAIKAKSDPAAYTQQKQAQSEYWTKPPTDTTYPHPDPEMKGITINREHDVAGNVTSNPGDKTIYVDRNLPPTVDVNGKPIDPAYPLAIREAARRQYEAGVADARKKMGVPPEPARDAQTVQMGADLAERLYLESKGYDHDAFKQAIGEGRPEVAPAAAPGPPAAEPAAAPAPAAPAPEPVAAPEAPPRPGPPGAPPEEAPPARPQPAPEPQPAPAPAPPPAPPPEVTGALQEGVPDFLRRAPGAAPEAPPPAPVVPPRPQVQDPAFARYLAQRAEGAAKDAAARATLETQQTESRRAKASARIGKMKATKAGETTAMPLQGRAALEAIRQRQAAAPPERLDYSSAGAVRRRGADPGIVGDVRAPEAKARTKPAERAAERAKIENGTAVDNPNWLSKAATEFIKDEGASFNYRQFLKTFTTLGGAYGKLQGRYPLLPEAKAPDTTFRVRKPRSEAEGYSRAISDDLYKNGQMRVNEQNDVEQQMKAMPAADKKLMADEAMEEEIYNAREGNKLGSLSEKARGFYEKYVKPYFDTQAADYKKVQELLAGDEWVGERKEILDRTNPNYVHRMAVGHTEPTDSMVSGVSPDPTGTYGVRGLRAKTSPLEARKFLAMDSADGDHLVISPNSEGYAIWRGRKPEQVNYDGATGHGSKIEYNGKEYTVGQATTKEIEQHGLGADGQPMQYYKNGMYSAINGMLKTREALRNLQLLKDLKSHPKWNDYTADLRTEAGKKKAEENGWQESKMPQMRGIAMDDNIRYAFDDWAKPGLNADALDRLRAVSQAVTKTLFFTPVPHALNAFWHWWVGRGWDWMNPNEYKRMIPELMAAYKSVMTQDALQNRMRAAGAGTVEGGIWMQGFQRRMAEAVGIDAKRNPAKWEALAEMMGFGKAGPAAVTDFVRAIYSASSNSMWTVNDILHTHQTMVNMRKGMSLDDAIRHTEIHIPNYRMPMTILSSRVLAQILGEPFAVAFGRYHSGVYSSLAHMTKSLVAGNAAQRNEAAGNVFALGLFALIMKPLVLDPMVQFLTGDDQAEMAPRGPLAPLHTLYDIMNSKKGVEALAGEAVSKSPFFNFLLTLTTNRDFAGHRIMTPGAPAAEQGLQFGDLLARGFAAPYGTIANAMNRYEDSGPLMKAVKAIGSQAVDIKTGRKEGAEQRAEKAIAREYRGRIKAPQGPLEALGQYLGLGQ